jgi:tetratricopeptide (TPR) repeat protein
MLNLNSLNLLQAKALFSMKRFFSHRQSPVFFAFLAIIFLALNFSAIAQTEDEQKDPVQLFNQGQDAHEKGDFKAALKLYEEALKIAPEFPEAEFQKGSALQSLGRETEAEKAFRRALELRENWILPMASLGEILVRNGKFTEAETLLNKVIEADGKNSTAYLALVEMRLKTKASPDVLKSLLQKLNGFPKADASIWAARGAIEKELGDGASAETSFARSLALDAKNSYALTETVKILLTEKNYPKALANANNLVKFYPDSVSANLLLARVFAENGNISEALRIIDLLDGNNSEVIAFRQVITAQTSGDVGALEKQLETDGKNPALLGRLCLLTRTIPQKALEYCRRASEAEPSNISHAIGFGAALVQAKQFDSAVNLFKRLLQFDAESYSIRANLATALFELKRYQEAKTEFELLIAKKPDLAVGYYFLAITHDNLAEYSEAKINYQKFLQLAETAKNQLEIDKVNLRMPVLEKQIKNGEGVKRKAKGKS